MTFSLLTEDSNLYTLLGTNISPKNGILKMIFLFPRWDMSVPWRVIDSYFFKWVEATKSKNISLLVLRLVVHPTCFQWFFTGFLNHEHSQNATCTEGVLF